MKILFYIFLIATAVSCGKISPKGKIAPRDIPLEDFDKIELSGDYRVFYVNAEKNFVNVETYPNITDNLKILVRGKTLSISERRDTKNVDFYNLVIYGKLLPQQISAAGNTEFTVSGGLKTDNLVLNLKNNAKFIGSVDTRRTEINMQDKSRANLRGNSRYVVIKIKDTASLIAPFWRLEDLKINSENGNYAEVNATDSIKGFVKNTAQLTYYGSPIRAFKIDKTANVQNKISE